MTYKQGMNEIAGVILLAMYPFYFKPEEKSSSKSKVIKSFIDKSLKEGSSMSSIEEVLKTYLNDNSKIEDFYFFFHDYDDIAADVYILFDNIMNRSLKELYDNTSTRNNNKKYDPIMSKKRELFDIQWETPNLNSNERPNNSQLPLQKRCNEIISKKLKFLDNKLYEYFNSIDITCSLFLQRWLKCMFNRELCFEGVILFWDCIFANDMKENLEELSEEVFNNLNMIDYLSVAMICALRDECNNY